MNVPSESPGAALELAELTPTQRKKRKRCDNCGAWIEVTKVNKRFCDVACKNEFNSHGSAFGPLKTKIEKIVRKLVGEEIKKLRSVKLATKADIEGLASVLDHHRKHLGAIYSRLRVLEAAVANSNPHPGKTYAGIGREAARSEAMRANVIGAHIYTDKEIGRRTAKPKHAGSRPSPRKTRKPLRNIGYAN